ncbi:MAG: dephospho-CoA kinase [Desulfovibrionales bacterium]|nr:MAG: dephospho-CoA kinase [Desulfovibrionales bacterium]
MSAPAESPTEQMELVAVVDQGQAGIRLDQFWMDRTRHLGITRSKIQAWIKNGFSRVDGRPCLRPGRRLATGERLELGKVPPQPALRPENQTLRIVYHDDDLVVLNKPAGLVVHPAPGLDHGTLVHRLLHHFPELSQLEGARPGIVHRLDKDTTGLMAVALTEVARLRLTAAFAERGVEKVYLALVHGRPDPSGLVDAPIGRHPTSKTRMAVVAKGGKPAHSEYTLLWTAPKDRFSLLSVRILSGRTHQIRVHMQHIGHPLLGDPTYCPAVNATWQSAIPGLNMVLQRPMLHAWKLGLPHPRSEEPMDFQVTPPKDIFQTILVGSRTTQRVGLTGMPGCGKSLLLAQLAGQGIPVWSADKAVAELYRPGQDGWELLQRHYGERFIPMPTEPVDKKALLQAMQEIPGLRREVEAMIHPLVKHHLHAFWKTHHAARVTVAEVPLLLESGWTSGFDLTVGLACDPPRRRAWLYANRGWDDNLLADMESWQWPEAKKLQSCDLVISNPGNREGLAQVARSLSKVLRWLRTQGVRRRLGHVQALVIPASQRECHVSTPR